MKTKILLTAALLFSAIAGFSSKNAAYTAAYDETIRIFTTPDTRKLVESWVTDYSQNNPGIRFDVEVTNLSEFNQVLTTDNSLGFLLKSSDMTSAAASMWQMNVGREVIVPVVNSKSPFIKTLQEKGVSAKAISGMLKSPKSQNWSTLFKNNENAPVHFYISGDAEVLLSVSKFLDIDPVEIKELNAKPAAEIPDLVKNDIYAIAFCRLADIVDATNKEFTANISLLPIDRNGNGNLDFNENYFANLENFQRAVWIGKYPKSLTYTISAVATTRPQNEAISGFLSWVLTSGQQMVEENGFTGLVSTEVRSNLEKIVPDAFLAVQPVMYNQTKTIILVSITFGLLLFFVFAVLGLRGKSARKAKSGKRISAALNHEALDIPLGLFFDKTHTWVFMEKEGTVKVGIDDFLQHVTGNFTGIIMKEPGEKLAKNEPAVTLVNEGKKLNIYAPVSGTIKEINEDLVDYPSLINSSPYAWGWIYTMEPTNWFREMGFLKMADSYKEWIKKEFIRLKDFLSSVSQNQMPAGQLVYQEGGELPDHVLRGFDPKVWEEFQIRFIDNSDIN